MTKVQKKFNKGKVVCSKNGADTRYPQTKKNNLDLTTKLTQNRSDLNVKQIIKPAKKNIGKNFQDLGLGE